MSVTFECVTHSRRSTREMFDRARDIDAHVRSQASADERAVGGVVSGLIGLGETVTWRARHFGIPFTLTSRITAFDEPHSFVDEQVRGPFRHFRHEHRFEPAGAGTGSGLSSSVSSGTVMTDTVSFTAPFGIVGRIAERLVLSRYLRRLIAKRGALLAEA